MEGAQTVMSARPRARESRSVQQRRIHRGLFLSRLNRIRELKAFYGAELTVEARRLIDRSLYSTYWDCVRLGARDDARRILGLPDH